MVQILIFFDFRLFVMQCHMPKQRKVKFEQRIEMKQNVHIICALNFYLTYCFGLTVRTCGCIDFDEEYFVKLMDVNVGNLKVTPRKLFHLFLT